MKMPREYRMALHESAKKINTGGLGLVAWQRELEESGKNYVQQEKKETEHEKTLLIWLANGCAWSQTKSI